MPPSPDRPVTVTFEAGFAEEALAQPLETRRRQRPEQLKEPPFVACFLGLFFVRRLPARFSRPLGLVLDFEEKGADLLIGGLAGGPALFRPRPYAAP
jgi:hypothetical protein